ncbi:MAG TPA: type II secretion system protein [Candidatus Woesebacteria bacterium]|nr:type II secretion system protein [Candidatus Woesebacteria bacterium]
MKKRNGFTFVELLVVITIIAVIFAAGVVSYSAIAKNSRDARRRADLEAIRQALEMCRSIAGEYPLLIYQSGSTGTITCSDSNATVTMSSTPVDPRPCDAATDGKYAYTTDGSSYTLTATCMEDTSLTKTVTNP